MYDYLEFIHHYLHIYIFPLFLKKVIKVFFLRHAQSYSLESPIWCVIVFYVLLLFSWVFNSFILPVCSGTDIFFILQLLWTPSQVIKTAVKFTLRIKQKIQYNIMRTSLKNSFAWQQDQEDCSRGQTKWMCYDQEKSVLIQVGMHLFHLNLRYRRHILGTGLLCQSSGMKFHTLLSWFWLFLLYLRICGELTRVTKQQLWLLFNIVAGVVRWIYPIWVLLLSINFGLHV